MMEDPNTNPVIKPDPVKPDTTSKSVVAPENNTVADNPIDPLSDRITPRQISTGMQRGEQTLSGTQIIVSPDGTERIIYGNGPNNEFGIFGTRVNNNDPSDLSIAWKQVGQTQAIFDDTNTKRYMTGEYPDGSIKIKLSQAGHDVTTATDDQLIWSSDFNLFKIVLTGTISINVPNPFTSAGSPLTATVTHNLGVRPSFLVFGDIPAGAGAYSGTGNLTNLPVIVGGGGAITVMAQAYVSTTNLTVQVINMFGANIVDLGTPWTFKYYLLRETAN